MKKNILLFFILFFISLIVYYYWPEKNLEVGHKITRIVVFKSKRRLNIYAGDTLLKSYKISLGRNPIGRKEFEGDNKTPEGKYFVNAKNPRSVCYKNLGISYPNKSDILVSKSYSKSIGGDIKIHGLPNRQSFWGKFHRFFDWTNGCIAVTNNEMEELYNSVSVGIPIMIKP
jgi:murein L,D-transpeptidase YafK